MKPYYQDDLVTLYHGDCREIIPAVPCGCVLVTDPPYGVNIGKHAAANETRGWLAKSAYASYDDTDVNFRSVVVPALELALEEAARGVVFMAGTRLRDIPEYQALGGVFLPSGMGRTCWGFQNLVHVALYGVAPDLHLGAKPTAFKSTEVAEKNGHPVPKPYGWMVWAVNLAALQHETVLDPFAGSGTTLAAAKQFGFKAIGIEIEERYCEIAARRLSQGTLAEMFQP